MYGIFTYIYPKNGTNVGKYSIHGASGIGKNKSVADPISCTILHIAMLDDWYLIDVDLDTHPT